MNWKTYTDKDFENYNYAVIEWDGEEIFPYYLKGLEYAKIILEKEPR